MGRQVIEDAVQPSVVAPAVLEEQNPTVLFVGQRPQMAQEGGGVRGRAEAHGLQDGVVAVRGWGWGWDRGRFGGLGQEGGVCVVRVEV